MFQCLRPPGSSWFLVCLPEVSHFLTIILHSCAPGIVFECSDHSSLSQSQSLCSGHYGRLAFVASCTDELTLRLGFLAGGLLKGWLNFQSIDLWHLQRWWLSQHSLNALTIHGDLRRFVEVGAQEKFEAETKCLQGRSGSSPKCTWPDFQWDQTTKHTKHIGYWWVIDRLLDMNAR